MAPVAAAAAGAAAAGCSRRWRLNSQQKLAPQGAEPKNISTQEDKMPPGEPRGRLNVTKQTAFHREGMSLVSLAANPVSKPTKVFVSYVAADREFVHKLIQDLQEAVSGARFLYDLNLPPGKSLATTLVLEIKSADVVLAILSPDYLASEWAEQESSIAVQANLEGPLKLLPVLARPCSPTNFIRYLKQIDFSGDYRSGLTELVWGITGQRPFGATGDDPGSATVSEIEINQQKTEVDRAVANFQAPQVHRLQPGATHANSAFVVMPFSDRLLNELYKYVVKPTLKALKISCHRGDDKSGGNVIVDDIIDSIGKARIVIADLSGQNPNVMYEVGLSHAMGKEVLLLSQSIDDVPFDLRLRRVIIYENRPRGAQELAERLTANLLSWQDSHHD